MQHVSPTKIPRLQRALQEFDENFDVIGLVNFSWDHTVIRSPSHHLSGRKIPEPKEHDHQEQVCCSLSCWQGENVQIVRHGTEDYTGAFAASPA